MDAKERRAKLRGAVNRADGVAVVELAREWLGSEEALQLLGDGLLAALFQGVAGEVSGLAAQCAVRLRNRGWEGDEELADQLEAARAGDLVAKLHPLAVDLEELAMLLEGDELGGGGRIDRGSGEIWSQAAIDYAEEMSEETVEDDDDDRWLWVDSEGSEHGYRDMQAFIGTVTDPGHVDLLEVAISGRGAFRRFKDVLARWPGEIERWYAFSEERQRGRARAWLAVAGYAPSRSGRPAP